MIDLLHIERVAVGSTNPVKVQAVQDVLQDYVHHAIEVVGISAPSGVGDMPSTEEDTKLGSYNRAQRCLQQGTYDLAFGLEGGVYFDEHNNCYLFGCATCLDSDEYYHTCIGPQFLIPRSIGDRVHAGEELGPVLDDILGEKDTKKKQGMIGWLTHDRISRKASFVEIVTHTLIPWLHADLYTG